jgi:tight adherence protein B
MATLLSIGAYVAIFIAALLVADAIIGFIRAAQGFDEGAVERRLTQAQVPQSMSGERIDVLRRVRSNSLLLELLGPLYEKFARFVLQAHIKNLTADRTLGYMALISFVTLLALAFALPPKIAWVALLFAPIVGIGSVLAFISRARTQVKMKFEEQLPDALDLIVRSLKIGHPVSSAIGLIAREMPEPIGPEFGIVAEQISYGRDLPQAVMQMQERVPATDLAYFSMAVQIQMESGGNLVESLQKLANVIRDRYRMFRKAHAITAEGRFSAWALSLFPFVIAFALQLVRPDYYTQVANEPWFPYLVVVVVVMLIVNVIMMRALTTIKV